MPYNNTPIPPPEEYNGTNYLPLARVQKIINSDEQVENCSKNAAFAIAIAAEEFIWYLVEQTQNVSKSERRGSRNKANLQYKDIANAIARHDNLEFLTDAVPKTIPYREYKDRKEQIKNKGIMADAVAAVNANGQRTLEQLAAREQMANGAGPDRDVEMADASFAGPSHSRGLSNGHINGPMTNGFGHAPPTTLTERPPTADGAPRPAIFDVVRNGFQASPESGAQP
ncbi:hypothetical protein FH972_024703 [Carpinus fangiana]|uniref:Transcription factor CBF/NF-Y/archaeal histone domain-containing protein n=1 Tax=Carpinus fangiana TaxID=176857 RepID=A0A5N6KZ99_9ROSI|nr:hypothetical protein FH972_024703 [Carpinus fangiana]